MSLSQELERRRRELGMSRAWVARRSQVSLPTVNRILSGGFEKATFANVVAVGQVLGIDLVAACREPSEELRNRQARNKAAQLVGLVQGTSGLEGQAVDLDSVRSMIAQASKRLLQSKRRLWSE